MIDNDFSTGLLPQGMSSSTVTIGLVIWAVCIVVALLPGPGGGFLPRLLGVPLTLALYAAFGACVLWGGWSVFQAVFDGFNSDLGSPGLDDGGEFDSTFSTVQAAIVRAFLLFPPIIVGSIWWGRQRWLALVALVVAFVTALWVHLPSLLA